MDEHGQNLTPEEEALKKKFLAEDPNAPGIEGEFPEYVPFPTQGEEVVAELIPTIKR